ncbi:Putative ribonuclease H protein At1g65750 [Linum perenne]
MAGLEEWRLAQGTRRGANTNAREEGCRRWHKPPVGVVKINLDAALFDNSRRQGLGMVARDAEGGLLGVKQTVIPGVSIVKEAEASCLREAIWWAMEMGLAQVIFETDSLSVQQAVEAGYADATEFGKIVGECRALLLAQPQFKVAFVRRECNRIADALAKRSLYSTVPSVGEVTPDWLVTMLDDVCQIADH